MRALMGFTALDTTKGKKVAGNLDPVLNINKKKRRYRCVRACLWQTMCVRACVRVCVSVRVLEHARSCVYLNTANARVTCPHLTHPAATCMHRQYMNRKGGFNRLLANQQ